MMYGFNDGMSGWGYVLMALSMIGFWALVVIAAVALLRHRPASGGHSPPASPDQLLAERFARGEIDDDEYYRRLAVLEQGRLPHEKGS